MSHKRVVRRYVNAKLIVECDHRFFLPYRSWFVGRLLGALDCLNAFKGSPRGAIAAGGICAVVGEIVGDFTHEIFLPYRSFFVVRSEVLTFQFFYGCTCIAVLAVTRSASLLLPKRIRRGCGSSPSRVASVLFQWFFSFLY